MEVTFRSVFLYQYLHACRTFLEKKQAMLAAKEAAQGADFDIWNTATHDQARKAQNEFIEASNAVWYYRQLAQLFGLSLTMSGNLAKAV